MERSSSMARDAAEALAVEALTYLAGEPERLARFLDLSGIDPASIRAAAREPRFLAGVLEHVASDERLLTAFAAAADIEPAAVDRARAALAGRRWERDVP